MQNLPAPITLEKYISKDWLRKIEEDEDEEEVLYSCKCKSSGHWLSKMESWGKIGRSYQEPHHHHLIQSTKEWMPTLVEVQGLD